MILSSSIETVPPQVNLKSAFSGTLYWEWASKFSWRQVSKENGDDAKANLRALDMHRLEMIEDTRSGQNEVI